MYSLVVARLYRVFLEKALAPKGLLKQKPNFFTTTGETQARSAPATPPAVGLGRTDFTGSFFL
jgi:hypothetical protein